MLDINKVIWYKDNSIVYDDLGYWIVQFCGDDIVFDTVNEAKEFIDKEMI